MIIKSSLAVLRNKLCLICIVQKVVKIVTYADKLFQYMN